MDSDNPDDDFLTADTPGFRWPFGWGVMLALGWLAFELTAQPRFGIAVTCTKLMWNDLVTARWWIKRDPWWQRRVCVTILLVIRAITKYSFTLMGICMVSSFFENSGKPFELTTLRYSFVIGYGAFILGSIAGVVITPLSIISGVRLWLDKGVTESRRVDHFPPKPRGMNQTGLLLLGTRFFECFLCGILLSAITKNLPVNDNGKLLLIVLGIILLLFCQYHLTHLILAMTPQDGLYSGGKLAPPSKGDDGWD